MSKHTYILFLFFCLSAFPQVFGQNAEYQGIPDKLGADSRRGPSLPSLREKARKRHDDADYGRAIQYYQMILDARPKDVEALRGLADAAYLYTRYEKAAWAYQVLLDSSLVEDKDGLIAARLADSYFGMGKFERARLWYDYLEAVPGASAETRARVDAGLARCDAAERDLEDMKMKGAQVERLPRGINTRYAEYAPTFSDNLLYYTTFGGFPYREDETAPERGLMKIVIGERHPDTVFLRDPGFNEERRHVAYAAFNSDKSRLYYAIGKDLNDHQIRFELYRRKKQADNSWGPAERLPDKINLKDYTTTQPNVGTLPGEKYETLFFVSDRPRGHGGKDIWYCRIENDSFGQPQNLDSLNTPGEDVSPFFHNATRTLYFSSTGYPKQGLGGFDILRSTLSGKRWSAAKALPPPLNSGANDIFYNLPDDCENMAFFASNVKGAMNFSEEDCCYDLYRAVLKKPEFEAVAFHKITGDSLRGTTMRLFELAGNTPLSLETETLTGAHRRFEINPEKKYLLVASKPGFVPDTITIDGPASDWRCLKVDHLRLRPIQVRLIASVFDCDTKEPITGARFKFYDVAKEGSDGNLAGGQGAAALDSVISVNETGHTQEYQLAFGHRYHVALSKEGYTEDAADASTVGLERDDTLRVNLYLCQGLELDVYVWHAITKEPLDSVTIDLNDRTKDTNHEHWTGADNNEYHTEIFYNRRYRVSAERNGFFPDTVEFLTNELPRTPFHRIRQDLYLIPNRIDFLPITLYFHNDEPGPHTKKDTVTATPYFKTYLDYYNLKKEYLREYTAGHTGADRAKRYAEMDTFFEARVKGGWEKLRALSEDNLFDILNSLDSGSRVVIVLKGYASPLGNAPYNLSLSKRRAKSVENHFSQHEGFLLQQFMEDSTLLRNGTVRRKERDATKAELEIRFEPYGSSTAPAGVNATGKMAIYSVAAAEQRRVEVVGVEVIPLVRGAIQKLSGLPDRLRRKEP